MLDYLTVKCNGFITYCNALIARFTSDEAQSFFLSLLGAPAHVQATSAGFFSGDPCQISSQNHETFELTRCIGKTQAIMAKKFGDTVNKVLISADHFPGRSSKPGNNAVVFGPDMETVKKRAFHRLDSSTTMPMKADWQEWLWDEVLQPEKLYSFGSEQLREAWLISRQDDFEDKILAGIRQGYLV